MSDNTTDFFDNIGGGAGAPSAQLKAVGDFVHGEIVEMFKRDYIPFGKTEPEKDDKEEDGKRKQLVVILQTPNRNWAGVVRVPKVDAQDPNSAEKPASDDDGKRAVYVPNRSNIQFAIGRAVQASQSKFEVGGTLGVRIANLKDVQKGNLLKEHEAKYEAKPAATGDAFFGGTPAAAPAPQAPAAPAAPAPQAPVETPSAAAPAAPAPSQDPWATPAPSAPAAPAPSQDPWATPAPSAPAAGDPWATPGTATDEPPF